MRQVWALALVALALVSVTAPLSAVAASAAPLKVVATTGMIADAARQIGGKDVEVQGLMGPGIDPHAYRQTRSDIIAVSKADLVLWHGLFLEAQLETLMRRLEKRRNVIAVAERLPRERLIAHGTYDNKFDPHIWMDPELWSRVVETIRDALIAARPQSEAVFRANAQRHLADIADVAAYAKQVLATVPEDGRVLLTAHDAFNYFGRAYGFEVVGIQGISTESEAGLKRVSDLVEMLVDRGITAVFVESSVSDRNVRALIEGAAAQGQTVSVGGELYSDAMGEPGTYEGTYLGMIDHNVTTIARALGGTAPAKGRIGRLSAGS